MIRPLLRSEITRFWETFSQSIFPDDPFAPDTYTFIFDDWKGAFSLEFDKKGVCELCISAAKGNPRFFSKRFLNEVRDHFVNKMGGNFMVTRMVPGATFDWSRFGFREYKRAKDGTRFFVLTSDDNPPWRRDYGKGTQSPEARS